MNYGELLKLGFKRNECLANDSIYFDIYGYACFYLEKILHKDLEINWSPETQIIELIRYNAENVIDRRQITKEECLSLCNIFGRKGKIQTYSGIASCC